MMAALSGWKKIKEEYVFITDIDMTSRTQRCIQQNHENADLYTYPIETPYQPPEPPEPPEPKRKTTKKKFNINHINWILHRSRNHLSPSKLKLLFQSYFRKNISTTTITKMRKGAY